MSHANDHAWSTPRRAFLQAGAVAAAAGLASARAQDAAPADPAPVLPRRKLGRTDLEVTILEQGAVRGPSYDRILRYAYSSGIRVFDAAKVYGTEPNLQRWFAQSPEIRKEIILVTKDMPRAPRDMIRMLDERLAGLQTDYVDLFFIHGLGDDHTLDDAMNFVKGPDFKAVAETIRKSGKARYVGFSSHHKDRPQLIQAAAAGGVVDAIMLQYAPWLAKDAPLNHALDAAHKAGIGLITMKQIAGKFFGDKPTGNILEDVVRRVPDLKERKLTPFQGLLHAIWTDERISASCVSMRNLEQIRENVDAARRFEPLKQATIEGLRDAVLAHGATLCADCDGRCGRAAGTTAELGDLTRFLTYHKHLGDRVEARRQYAALGAPARNWKGADLAAAQAACPGWLDFARLLPEADRLLGPILG
jgi:aryl-alcohol dehydrogenase-like predicted oxidoreductase